MARMRRFITAIAVLVWTSSAAPCAFAQAERGVTNPAFTIADVALVAAGTEDLVGRSVLLTNVRVLRLTETHGFFLAAAAGAVLVVPERFVPVRVNAGDIVTIHGVIAHAPRPWPGKLHPPIGWNPRIYVVATYLTK